MAAMEDWELKLSNVVKDSVDKHIQVWGDIVRRLGVDGADRETWVQIFKENTDDFLTDMVNDAAEVQKSLFQKIENLLKQCEDLCRKLSIKMPAYGSQHHGLYQEEKLLQKKIHELEEKVTLRTDELKQLYEREHTICGSLGKDVKKLNESPLPSEDQIEEYIQYIQTLEHEKYIREEQFITCKYDIMEIAKELNFKPSLDFENIVLSEDDNNFTYTDKNMKELDSFHSRIKQENEYVKQEISTLRETLRSLWDILTEDLIHCDTFMQNYPGNTYNTLEALKAEVERCEVAKKANIEVFVHKYREELINLWTKCRYTPEERSEFHHFYDVLYTEDLLTLHSMEIEKLKRYYNKNKEIFELLEKREQLWEKKIELEDKETNNKDRYKNRGGQLLKEEKERNALYKRIPKLEEQLLQMTAAYEINHGTPFLSFGETIESIIEKSHEVHEQDKKIKLSVRKHQRDLTITPGGRTQLGVASGSALRSNNNLAARTPLTSASKRKIATPLFSAKRTRPAASSTKKDLGYKSAPPKILLNNKTIHKGAPRYSTEKKKRMERMRRLSKLLSQKDENVKSASDSTPSAYESFEKELSTKESLRSTLVFASDLNDTPLALPLTRNPPLKVDAHATTPRRTPRIQKTKLTTAPGSNIYL